MKEDERRNLEILEDFDERCALSSGVRVAFGGAPGELSGLTERLVAQCHRGVDDVLTVANHRYEAGTTVEWKG